jgi:DnaJ like chaperone protein
MTFWRNIANLAARRVDLAECPECPAGLPGQDPAFSTAVTALGAKLARADGRADAGEYAAFAEVFQPDAGSEADVRRLYDLARQTTLGFEGYARRLAKRYHGCPQLLEDVLDGLFHIAASDGAITFDELDYLEQVSVLLGLSPLTFRRLKATHMGLGAEDPYAVLGIAPDASDEAVHSAWRSALSEAHPDRVIARGLPAEYVEVAQAKAAAINAAFDTVTRERRAMAGAGAGTG